MKHIITILLLLPLLTFSQQIKERDSVHSTEKVSIRDTSSHKPFYIYAQIVRKEKVKILSVERYIEIEFGESTEYLTSQDNKALLDPGTGKQLKFKNMMDAMNLMSKLGWELAQTYIETENFVERNPTNIVYWIIKKRI